MNINKNETDGNLDSGKEKTAVVIRNEKYIRGVLDKIDHVLSSKKRGYISALKMHLSDVVETIDLIKGSYPEYNSKLEQKIKVIDKALRIEVRILILDELENKKRGYKKRIERLIKEVNAITDIIRGNGSLYFPHFKLIETVIGYELFEYIPEFDEPKKSKQINNLVKFDSDAEIVPVDIYDWLEALLDAERIETVDCDDDYFAEDINYRSYFPEINMDSLSLLEQEDGPDNLVELDITPTYSTKIAKGSVKIILKMEGFDIQHELTLPHDKKNAPFLIQIIFEHIAFGYKLSLVFNQEDFDRNNIFPPNGSNPHLN